MSIKRNIKKIITVSLWAAAGISVTALLVAGMDKKSREHCAGVSVSINGADGNNFLDRAAVLAIIAPDKNNPPENKPINSFDLQLLEKKIRQNPWVKEANLYFDNNSFLKVVITERIPVARVFTSSGQSFYMDSSGKQLPLHEAVSFRLPVFTGYPKEKLVRRGSDSLLIVDMKNLSNYIIRHPFWAAQVTQITITPDKNFEFSPLIGNHTILFGKGDNHEEKFKRLLLFYQQVSARVGFDKYSMINVQYAGQVVATRRGTVSKIDSIQALKNVQQLIEASGQYTADSLLTSVDNNIMVTPPREAPLSITVARNNTNSSNTVNTSVPTTSQQPVLKPQTNPSNINDKPKALMPKGDKQDDNVKRNN